MNNTQPKVPLKRGRWRQTVTLLALVWFGATATTQALTNTWSGAVDNLWSTTGNWDQGALATTDTNYFNGGGAITTVNLDSSRTIGGLLIGSSQGSALTLTNFASTLTINAFGINMSAAGADLTSTVGTIALGANQTWNVGSGRTLYMGSVVSGAYNLTKSGAGTLTLTGTNSYSGATTVSVGTLLVNGGGITNTASMTLNGTGASLILTNGASLLSSTAHSYIGNGANGNTVFIYSNSLWNAGAKYVYIGSAATITSNSLTVADGGILTNVVVDFVGTYGNLVITNGGKILAGTAASTWAGALGDALNSNSNRVTVGSSTGSKSVWDLGGKIVAIGKSTSVQGNGLVVDAGGVISNGTIRIGDNATANGNGLIITNGGQASLSTVSVGGYNGGYSNYVIVAGTDASGLPATLNGNGNTLYVGASSATGSSGNWVRVEAGGVVTNAQIILGYTGNSVGNSMMITNGGQVFSSAAGTIGNAAGANSNSVTIAGAYGTTNSLWNMGGKALTIGGNTTATGNWMTVSTGGVLTNGSVTLGGVGSVFNLSGQAYLSSVTNGASGTFTINGAGMLGNGVFTGNITNDGAFVFASSAGQTLSGPVSGSGSLTNLGSGVLTLTGTNTYTGVTFVSAGELVGVTGGSCSNSAFTVAAGGTNGVQIATVGGTWACKALTNNLGGAMDFNFVTPAVASSAPIQVLGDLDVSGVNVIVRGAVSGSVGSQYELIKYQGVLSGTVPATAVSLPVGVTGTLSNNTANHSIDLVLTSTSTNYWAVGSGNWNVSAMNWKNTAASGVTNAFYIEGEAVVLDDTASGAGPILVTNTATVSPSSVTVSNVTKAYTISGAAISGGAALTKLGANTLTLSSNNTYSGGTTVNAGTLVVGNTNALGTGLLTMGGGVLTNAAGTWTFTNAINLAGTATVGIKGTDLLTLGGIVTNSGSLTKTGAGTLTLANANTYSGGTTNTLGALAISNNTALGSGTVTMNGGSLTNAGGNWTVANVFDLASAATVGVGGTDSLTLGGIITNSGALTKAGTGTLTLTGTNSYSGATTVSAGTLLVNGGGITNTASMTLNGTGASLILTNGASLFSVSANTSYIGSETGNNSNSVIIAGSGSSTSLWSHGGGNLNIGKVIGSTGNWMRVDNGGVYTNAASMYLAFYGVGGSLTITNGGQVFIGKANIYLGAGIGSTNNSITIASTTNAQSVLNAQGGVLYIGGNKQSAGTWVQVGQNGLLTNVSQILVGHIANSVDNYMIITNGGQVFSSDVGTIGNAAGANSNFVTIAGANGTTNALWDLGKKALTIGLDTAATGNWMTVSTGGVLTNGRVTLGGVGSVFTIGGDAYLSNVNVSVSDAQLNFNGGTLHATANGNLISGTVWTNTTAASLDAGGYTVTNAVLIAGAGSLTNLGSGTLMMISNNTYSGATVVQAGKLVVVTGGSCSNSAFTVAAGATNGVVVATSGGNWICKALTSSVGGVVDFTFTVQASTTAADAPIQVLNTLDASNVRFAIRGAIAGLSGTRYPLVKYESVVGAGPWTVSLPEGVSGSIEKNEGTSTLDLVLTANSAVYRAVGSGNWDVNSTMNWKVGAAGSTANAYYQDTLPVIFDDSASGTGILLVTNVANVSPTSVLVSNTTAKSYLIRGAMITGSAALTKEGTGTFILGTNNAYTGGTTINAGTLVVSNANALGTGSVTLNGGTLRLGSSLAITNLISATSAATIDLGGAGRELTVNEGDNTTFAGAMTNAGSLVKAAAGTLTLTGTNSYRGATTISNGTLAISGTGVLGNGVFTGSITNHGAFVYASSAAQTLSGPISGSGSLTNLGPGTLTLGGNNTYVGNTTVSNGTLLVDGSIASSACTVNSGATLGGTGTVGAVIMASGATNAPGHNGVGTLHSGNVELQAGSTLAIQIDSGANAADKLASSGAVTIGSGAKLSLSDLGTATLGVGTSYVLVSRTSGAGTTFDGYPEGHYFSVGQNDYRITYEGGAGYDVVITRPRQGSVYTIR